jgi:ubiquitin carboxyl-terminal hydrolase 16
LLHAFSAGVGSYEYGPPAIAISNDTSEDWQQDEHRQRETTLIALVAGTGLASRMPERPLTIATYAAGASLAAITLVYVFGPTFFLDDEAANSSRSSRKKGVVGLYNPANDCFINSVLQVLAGLPQLRLYLIREMHRRKLDGAELYQDLTAALEEQQKKKRSKPLPEWKLLGLQQGLVTAGLKEVLDALNERPIYKKIISAQPFIKVVEHAFKTRISRSQQDAQEFLQVVAERLADEHYAGRRARRYATQHGLPSNEHEVSNDMSSRVLENRLQATMEEEDRESHRDSKVVSAEPAKSSIEVTPPSNVDEAEEEDEADRFPLEGLLESEVECSHCHFKPRPHVSSFVTLTLNVPQNAGSSTLNACFDGMFKQEQIDDFTCDKCRLVHALELNAKAISRSSGDDRIALEQDREKLQAALNEDPEKPPKDVKMPHLASAPKRRIARHMRISRFPKVLAIHLSRSVWDPHSSSSKNTAKVAFSETLPLGGLIDRKTYRLLGAVTHKGGHNSGHYESFRRQFLNAPFSTPTSMGTEGIYSVRPTPVASPRISAAPSPRLSGRSSKDTAPDSSPDPQLLSTPSLDSPTSSSASSHSLPLPGQDRQRQAPTSVPLDAIPTPGLPTPPPGRQTDSSSLKRNSGLSAAMNRARRKSSQDRWWRISDEKIKEGKTSDVLGMQREVYLLFYEMIEP